MPKQRAHDQSCNSNRFDPSRGDGSAMRSEKGSVAPLAIGLMALTIALIFTLASANSMYLLRNRLTSAAEFAALAEARFGMTASDFLISAKYPPQYFVDEDYSSDQKTTEVSVCAVWVAPLPVFTPVGALKICGRGAARAG